MTTVGCAVGASWGLEVARRVSAALPQVRLELALFPDVLAHVIAEKPRYVFCLNWSHLVPAALTEQCAFVNFHCTPLPFGRGGHPIENMILRGHTETVITAHRMTAELDAGPIYGVSPPVSLAGTKAEILSRFVAPCAALMRTIIETDPEPVPQVGEVVRFTRLFPEAYQAFWGTRA